MDESELVVPIPSNLPSPERIAWVRIETHDCELHAPLLLGQSHLPRSDVLTERVQLENSTRLPNFGSMLHHGVVTTTSDSIVLTATTHAVVGAREPGPDTFGCSLVSANLKLPTERTVSAVVETPNPTRALDTDIATALAALSSEPPRQLVRVGASSLADTIESTECTAHMVCGGKTNWDDTGSQAYADSIKLVDLQRGRLRAGFAVTPANRAWVADGGDPAILVAQIASDRVDRVNSLLRARCNEALSAVARHRLDALILRCIGGDLFGSSKGKLLIDLGAGHERELAGVDTVMSSTILVRPRYGQVELRCTGPRQLCKSGLQIPCTVILMRGGDMRTLRHNPRLFGAGTVVWPSVCAKDLPHLAAKGCSIVETRVIESTSGRRESGRDVTVLTAQGRQTGPLAWFKSYLLPVRPSAPVDAYTHPLNFVNAAIENTPTPRLDSVIDMSSLNGYTCGVDRQMRELLVQRHSRRGGKPSIGPPVVAAIQAKSIEAVRAIQTAQDLVYALTGTSVIPVKVPMVTDVASAVVATTMVTEEAAAIVWPTETSPGRCGPIREAVNRVVAEGQRLVQAAVASSGHEDTVSILVPCTHTMLLGTVTAVVPLAVDSIGRVTNNRAVVAVMHSGPYTGYLPDATVLFVNKETGTDPDYFSGDLCMDTSKLYKSSSIRCALEKEHDPDFVLGGVRRVHVHGKRPFSTQAGVDLDGRQFATLSVKWKARPSDPDWSETFMTFIAANRLQSDCHSDTPMGRIVSVVGPKGLHSQFNANWRLRVL
jgi:hypothetical protein